MRHQNSYNKIILIGHVGRDPEVRYTQQNRAVANFSLATTDVFKSFNSGETEKRTQWHKIVAWGKLAEFVEKFINKGKHILVEGNLRYNTWTGQDGVKRTTAEIYAESIVLLGKRDSSQDKSDGFGNDFNSGGGFDDYPDTDEPLPF